MTIGSLKCFGTTAICEAGVGQSFSVPPAIVMDNCNLATLETTKLGNRLKIFLEYKNRMYCHVVLSLPEEKKMTLRIDNFNVSVLAYIH